MKQFYTPSFKNFSLKNFFDKDYQSKPSKSFGKIISMIMAFVFLAGFGSLKAQLLVTEDFNYATSSTLVVANGYTANTGTGTNNLTIAASGTGLSYTGSPRSAVGLALPMLNSGEDAYRSYTSQTTGAVYASALINLSAVNATGDYFFSLMTGATYNVRLYAKTSGAGYVLGVGKSSGTAVYDATVRALSTTFLVVIKYQFNTGTATDDVVSLFISPALGGTEPAATVSTGSGTTDAASISSYGFRQGTAANAPTLVIDGIMVGTSWAAVTQSGSIKTSPTSLTGGTLTGFTYAAGSGPSTAQSFTVTASNLTAGGGTLTVTGSTNYEVSTTSSTTGFGPIASLTYTGTGTIASNTVWVRLKAGLSLASYNNETITVTGGGGFSLPITASGSVTAASTITPTPSSLTGFSYFFGAGPSTSQSFTIAAANLTAGGGTITITGSTNYEVSTTTSTTGFGATATLTYTGTGTLAANTIWVRLKTGLAAANYNLETIAIAGGGASSSITASGSVTNPTITPSAATLTGFFYVQGSGPSTSQSVTVSASNLTTGPGTITITGSTNYEVSTTSSTTGFGASTTLGYTGTGTISPNTLWIRLKAGLSANTYNGETISLSGGGASAATITVSGFIYSGTFSSGNVAIETIGDGSTTLSGAAMKVNVREYTSAGTQTNNFTFPSATTSLPSSAPYYLTESGTATSAGQINRSTDGAQLILPGYNQLLNIASLTLTTTPANKRVMGIAFPDGTLNTNSGNDFFSAAGASTGIFRSIASNGYSYWAVGTSPVGAGLFYLKNASSTPVSLGSINTRVARIFNNILYYSTATTSNAGIFQVSTNGLPLSVNDVSIVRITDATYANTVSNASQPYAFEINPAGNILYIADQNGTFVNSATQKAGIIKYTKSGSTWSFAYTLAVPSGSATGLAVDWTTGGGSTPTLYVTTGTGANNSLAKIVDAGSSSTGSNIASAGANYVFRGMSLSPVAIAGAQLSCTANLLPFGGQPVGIASQEKAFNVAGTGFTGNILVSIPVTSPTGQYGLSLTPGGPYTSSVTLAGGSPANTTVYMVLNPNAVGTFNGNLTISATGASNLLVPVTGKGIIPVNYYNVSGADVTLLTNWGTNTNGSGTHPTNYTDDGQYFNINNTPLALGSSATTAVIDQLATTASGSPVLTFTGVPTCNNSPQSLFVGATITGTGIPGGTTIIDITANTITMSANATATDNIGTTISVAVTGPWTITGSLSKIVVGNGINFTIPSTRAYSGTADVAASGTLTLQNTTLPTFGTLDVASTVNYNQTGAASIFTTTYGNLTLQGSALDSRTLPSSSSIALDLKVLGSFVANNVTVSAATISPFTYMELGKDFTMSNGAVMLAATPTTSLGLLNIVTTGNSNQTFSYTGGGTIRLNTLSSTKSAGITTLATNTTLIAYASPGIGLTFSGSASFVSQAGSSLATTGNANINLSFTGSSTFTLGGNLTTSDNSSASLSTPVTPSGSLIASFPSGTSFTDGGNTLTVAGSLGLGGVASAYTLTGTAVVATQGGTSTIGDNALIGAIVPVLKNFTFAPVGGTGTTFAGFNGIVNIAGNFLISSAGTATTNKISGGSNTINIGGNYTDQRTIDMVSAGTSTWTFNGSSAQTFSTAYTSGESFSSAELINAAGLSMTSGDMKIGASGTLACTTGILTTGSNKVILNSTATISETTSSYVLGNVQTTRTLTTSAETFGNIGLSISAGTAPGATTVLRNTGTSNAIGCVNKSVKRTFTVTNSGSSLNATLAYTFVPANELNGLIQAGLSLYDVTGNTSFANSTISGNTITNTGMSTIAGTYSASSATPTIALSATANDVCYSASAQTSNLPYTASNGDITTYSITWSGAATGQGFTNVTNATIVASPIILSIPAAAVANTYSGSLTVKNSDGCTSVSIPFTVTINPTPLLSSSLTALTCSGTLFSYTATGATTGSTFNWTRAGVSGINNAASTNNATAIISETLVNTTANPIDVLYAFTITANGCTNVQNVTVTVNPKPVLSSTASPADVCSATPFNYTATSATTGTTYSWTRATVSGISNAAGSGSTASINETLINTTVAPIDVIYAFTLSANGCSNTQNVTVTINPTVTLTSTLTPSAVCSGDVFTYSATSGTFNAMFSWTRATVSGISNAAGSSSTSAISETLVNTTMAPVSVNYVFTLSANGCSNQQTVTVVVNPTPTLSSTLTPAAVCSGTPFNYTATSGVAGTTFSWTRGVVAFISNAAGSGSSASISETLNNAGTTPRNVTYVVTTSANGCSDVANVVVTVNPSLPNPTFTTSPGATVCANTDVTYTTEAGMTNYVWNVPGSLGVNYSITSGSIGSSSNTVTLKWLTPGSKTVTVNYNNAYGCTPASPASSSTTVNAQQTPSVTIAIKTGNNPTCDGGSVVMKATPVNGGTSPTYQWFKNGTPVAGNLTDTLLVPGITSSTPVYAIMTVGTGICSTLPTATSATTTITTVATSWTGSYSNNWFDKRNWCSNSIPAANTDVYIPVTSRNPVILGSANAFADNINIAAGATVTISNVTLVVSRTVTGTGTFTGNGLTFANNGAIGTLYFGAAGIKNLSLTGTAASATLGGATNVYGGLNVGNATLNTGGNLTLKSDINGTAWVGTVNGGSITGNVTVERYIPKNAFRAWRMLSVPVQGAQTFKQAWQENQAPLANGNPGYGVLLTSIGGGNGYDAATSGNSLLSFTNGNPGSFSAVSATTNAMATTSGYFVYVRGDRSSTLAGGVFNPTATTLRTNGNLYIGDQTTITLPAGINVMVGNLYAAPIDFALLTKSGISSFKVWDPKLAGTGNVGAYQTFSSTNGYDPTPGGGSYGSTPNSRIESGEAFIVNSTSGGSIRLIEAAKVTGSRNVFKTSGQIQQMKISLFALNNANGKQLADGNAVVFDDQFSNATDNDDALKTDNMSENIAIAEGGQKLTIDARKLPTQEDVIRLNTWNLKQQKYSVDIDISRTETALSGLEVYLVDKYKNTTIKIGHGEATSYVFDINADAASAAKDRFSIVFGKPAQTATTSTIVKAKAVKGNVEVSWTTAAEKSIRSYQVERSVDGANFSGIFATNAKSNNGLETAYQATDEKANNGDNYYRIAVTSANGRVDYSNTAKVQMTKETTVSIYPNPVVNGKINLQFYNAAKGNYTATISNKEGQIILTQTFGQNSGSAARSLQLPTSATNGTYQVRITTPDQTTLVQTVVVGK